MSHEYDDPFNAEMVEAAVTRALALHQAGRGQALERHVETAVHETACSCAIAIEDQIEQGRSGLHEAIAREVRRRVEDRLRTAAIEPSELDVVDQASDDSFPASDPPGWIWERPT